MPNVIAIPAEAEPDMADRTFVVTAPLLSGWENTAEIPPLATLKPGRFEILRQIHILLQSS
ncbi:hypothetical protein D3C84_980400 [compost metagenome]